MANRRLNYNVTARSEKYYSKTPVRGSESERLYIDAGQMLESGFRVIDLQDKLKGKYDISDRYLKYWIEKASFDIKKRLAMERKQLVSLHLARYENMFQECIEFEPPEDLPGHIQHRMKSDKFMTAAEMLKASEYLYGFYNKDFREKFKENLEQKYELEQVKFDYDFSKLTDKQLFELYHLIYENKVEDMGAMHVNESDLHESDTYLEFEDVETQKKTEYADSEEQVKHETKSKKEGKEKTNIIDNGNSKRLKSKSKDQVIEGVHEANKKALIRALKKRKR